MTGLPKDVPTIGVEIEWYPPQPHVSDEGRIYIVPLEVGKQGDDAVRDYIDGRFHPRYTYLFTKSGSEEIDKAMSGEFDR